MIFGWIPSQPGDGLRRAFFNLTVSFRDMRLTQLRLRQFRNYERLDVQFDPGFHIFMGRNGRGKTNILEAIYALATLRSFRGVGSTQMIRHGQKGFFIGGQAQGRDSHEVKYYWSPREKKLSLNQTPIFKVSDFFGVLRAVVFCSDDLLLVKGPSKGRRRYLDYILAQCSPSFLNELQIYQRALMSRNAAMKGDPRLVDERVLDSFTPSLIKSGEKIMEARAKLLPELAKTAMEAYETVASGSGESLQMAYQPSVKEDFTIELRKSRERERFQKHTVIGPHRDDLKLALDDKPVAQFASEGQKRSVAIAMKIAQVVYLTKIHGVPPILLIDDIMGELDAHRRAALLPLLESAHQARGQVFMTCTEKNWTQELTRKPQFWTVNEGLSNLETSS